jgi:hypothetical protein
MIGFYDVVGVLLSYLTRGRQDIVEHPRVDRCPVGRDLHRYAAMGERASEEVSRSCRIPAPREQDVDHLPMLIHSPIQIGPAAGDLDVGLVDEPAITHGVPGGSRRVDELGSERLHPPVDSHMINLDATFGEQLLDIAIRQAVTQVPAHRDSDHLAREPVARGSRQRRGPRVDHHFSATTLLGHRQRNRASPPHPPAAMLIRSNEHDGRGCAAPPVSATRHSPPPQPDAHESNFVERHGRCAPVDPQLGLDGRHGHPTSATCDLPATARACRPNSRAASGSVAGHVVVGDEQVPAGRAAGSRRRRPVSVSKFQVWESDARFSVGPNVICVEGSAAGRGRIHPGGVGYR